MYSLKHYAQFICFEFYVILMTILTRYATVVAVGEPSYLFKVLESRAPFRTKPADQQVWIIPLRSPNLYYIYLCVGVKKNMAAVTH